MGRISSFTLILVLFFLIGFGITGWATYCAFKSWSASEWPYVQGDINTCELKEYQDDEGNTYIVQLDYSYKVSGQQHHSDSVAFGYSASGGREKHQALFDKLSKARTVKVRYNPSKPSESVITYGLNRFTVLDLIFGLMMLGFISGVKILDTISEKEDKSKYLYLTLGLTMLLFIAGSIALAIFSGGSDKRMIDRIEIITYSNDAPKLSYQSDTTSKKS